MSNLFKSQPKVLNDQFKGIKVFVTINSDLMDTQQLYLNPEITPVVYSKNGGSNRCFMAFKLSYTDDFTSKLLKLMIDENKEDAQTLLKTRIDSFYVDAKIDIITVGYKDLKVLKTIIKPSKATLKENKIRPSSRFQNPKNDKSWITSSTIFKNYVLREKGEDVKNIPFKNISNNKSDINCVYNYAKQRYPTITKSKKYFDKDVVNVKDVEDFCENYKIKLRLYNINNKIIVDNGLKSSRYYKEFSAIICNNHLYPRTQKTKKIKLYDDKLEDVDKVDIKNDIIMFKQSSSSVNIYTKNGTMSATMEDNKIIRQIDQAQIDNAFFQGLPSNFFFESECLKVKPLLFNTKNISKSMKCEHDINKAYYTMAFDLLDPASTYPIFSCTDFFVKYDNHDVKTDYYYLIDDKNKDELLEIGIISNFHNGHVIYYLIENQYIKKKNIVAFKKPSYSGMWSDVLKRIEKLTVDNPKINKEFVLYNGILGKTISNSSIKYTNIKSSDLPLLEGFYIEDENEDDEYVTIRKDNKSLYRYNNHVNIYNHIVSATSIYLLMYMDHMKQLYPDIKICKLKTDAIGFDQVVDIPDDFKDMFKLVDQSKMICKHNNYSFNYINFTTVKENLQLELDKFKENITYFGAPGTGKTTLVKKTLKYDYACTWTNVCSMNLKDDDEEDNKKVKTIYSLLNLFNPSDILQKFKLYKNKTIWIDEFSMINKQFWNYFAVMSLQFNVKFIITGDINQIPPIKEKVLDVNNLFIKSFFNKIETLHKDYRNKQNLIELRDNILNNTATLSYSTNKYSKYDIHIVFTHNARNLINSYIMKERNYIFKYTYINKIAVSVDISEGVLVSPRKSIKKNNLFKNDIWRIVEKLEDGYSCVNVLRPSQTNIFSMQDMLCMQLAFAVTAHSIQGATITENFCIHEAEKMYKVDNKILYTAVTRGQCLTKINIYRDIPIEPKNFSSDHIIKYNFISMKDDEEFDKFDKIISNI